MAVKSLTMTGGVAMTPDGLEFEFSHDQVVGFSVIRPNYVPVGGLVSQGLRSP